MSGRDLSEEEIRRAMPEAGLFEGKAWLASPRPFRLTIKQGKALSKLGHPMAMFQRACDRIYRGSAVGNRPRWVAELLDSGKPDWLVAAALDSRWAEEIARVIRPDLLLTEGGWAVTEIDSLPGGIGLTAWLSDLYGGAGWDVLGGKEGMSDAFADLLPENGAVIISDESADYRPEMQWLVDRIGGGRRLERAEDYEVSDEAVYRFFELFDWESIPEARALAEANVTPVMKHHLEEKLWLALLKTPSLQAIWRDELRGSHLKALQEVVPQGWVVDDAELPPHAALPHLNVQSWKDVGHFSQKERELVVKVSGFSEEAWGSRGVFIGHDMATNEWSAVLDRALKEAHTSPWVVQDYHQGEVVEHPYYESESGIIRVMEGRVRVCPYFFVTSAGRTELAGCLATIVPKDKKKIHGMRDGILVPCVIAED